MSKIGEITSRFLSPSVEKYQQLMVLSSELHQLTRKVQTRGEGRGREIERDYELVVV